MTDYLNNLPVELIYKIYDDVPSFDILTSLCLVNKRLRSISLNYPRFLLDFSYLKKKKHFDIFCAQLPSISSQIVSLTFSNLNDGTMPIKIDCFFLKFNDINNIFSNLHSLSLSHVDYNMWKSIKNHVKSLVLLTSLSVYTAKMFYIDKVTEFTSHLLTDLLYMSSTLKYLCLKVNNPSFPYISEFNLLEKVSSIKHLVLHNMFVDLENLSSIAPSLHTLDMLINYCNLNCSKRVCPFEHLKHLSIVIHRLNFSTIKQLLYPMIRLVHLTIIGEDMKDDMADAVAWEQILTNMLTFKFSFSFHRSTSTSETIEFDSFRSSFWLEKKRWYVGYDRCTVSGFSLLYSIPYFMDTYPWFYIKGPLVTKSTGPKITSLCNVNRLLLTDESLINNELLYRYMSLEQLYVQNLEKTFCLLFYDVIPFIDMSKITTFFIGECRSKINDSMFVQVVISMPNLHHIGVPLALLKLFFTYRWPNIIRLRIQHNLPTTNIIQKELMNNEIDVFYRSLSHLECLRFYHKVDLSICQLLNNKPKTISNIMIDHPINVTPANFHNFITHHWIEQNTHLRNFSYSCNELNTVSLWF